VINTGTTVNDTGQLEVPNRYDPSITYIFRSYEPGGLGAVNVTRAIALSSNVFFYTVGGGFGQIAGLGVNRLASYYHKFGLGGLTGLDLPGEAKGLVPDPEWKQRVKNEPWVTGDTYNMSVGQGDMLVTPLQMAVATAAIANGGSVVRPYILKEVRDDSGQPVKRNSSEVIEKDFIAPSNLQVVREAMRQVVTSGTACCVLEREVPVPVAAKTGTAETDPEGKRKPHAWFTAFAPFNDPQIVIVVLVENSGEGAQFAAPAVRETLSWFFRR
jgi:penicillin-binding protein 2